MDNKVTKTSHFVRLLRMKKKTYHRLNFSRLRWPVDIADLLCTSGKHSICSEIRGSTPGASTASAPPIPITPRSRPWSNSASAWFPLVGEGHRPSQSGFDRFSHLDVYHLYRCVQFEVEVALLNHDAWGMWSLVWCRLCIRPHFSGYYAIFTLRWTSLPLTDMLVFPSSGVLSVIPKRPYLTTCQRTGI